MDDYYSSDTSQQDDIYVFVKFLGQGAFGRVNLYRNSTNNTLVVWKEIDLKRLDTKMRNEAFAEVEILSILDHPNIIGYYKNFIAEDTLYIELEYAKGGTLTNFIKQQQALKKYFELDTVLWYLYQLISAVDYIHEIGIMHRDIKSLNIFLMLTGLLKLGDFGIAKTLDPKIGFLESQVGTPLYMSPELIEAKKYTFKSDIWALGCVAYEILTLKKVFEATNQLKLAIKITYQEIESIDVDEYPSELKSLVLKTLEKNPDSRPSARDLLNDPIFASISSEYNAKIESLKSKSINGRNASTSVTGSSNGDSATSTGLVNREGSTNFQKIASKLSEVYIWGGGKLLPKKIDFFKNENAPLQVSIGSSHYAILTVEKELYTASHVGSNSSPAKLGHGNFNTKIPKNVEAFAGISIENIACGEEMTCCVSDEGDLYVFGTNINGCLGLGQTSRDEWNDSQGDPYTVAYPTKVKYFEENNLKIKSVACGDSHCVALTHTNQIFTWGSGEYGRLGHNDEEDRWLPSELKFRIKYKFKSVHAGSDYSFLLTQEGSVLAFGNNEFNKLCLNENPVGFKNADNQKRIQDSSNIIYQQLTPKLVKKLANYSIVQIYPGQNHTAVIDEYGRLFTFGSNRFGQLGVGDTKRRSDLNQVGGSLSGHFVTNAACGDTFTICSTAENHIFSWGNRKDGRLGIDSITDDSSCVCLPRPLFGSLHSVSEMCAKHWYSIIIAEKILNSKSLKSVSYLEYLRGISTANLQASGSESDSVNSDNVTDELKRSILENAASSENFIIENNQEQTNQVRFVENNDFKLMKIETEKVEDTNDVPSWLKKDLEEADFIPIEPVAKKCENDLTPSNPVKVTLDEAHALIKQLQEENKMLKDENKTLIEKLNKLETNST